MRGIFPPHPIFLGSALDPDAARWIAAVGQANVTQPRGLLISDTIRELKAANVWAALDFLPVLAAENAASALVDWKARKTMTAVNSPTLTADRGYAFDGMTNYLTGGFIPSSDATASTGTNYSLGFYDRENAAGGNSYPIGNYQTTTQQQRFTHRTAGNAWSALLNSNTVVNLRTGVTDTRGLWVAGSDGVNAAGFYNGSPALTAALSSPGTAHTSIQLYIAALNINGVASLFRQCTGGYAFFGAQMTAAQQLAFYTIMQRYMTALGANV